MTPNKIMILDIETENKPYYGHLSSPKHPDNYVVAVGWAIDEQPYDGVIQHQYYESKEAAQRWLTIPDDVWLVVAHNASFEIDWIWQQCRDELVKFLARGGRFFCTQLGHYRLSNQQELYPALNDIAPLYGGTPKIDAVSLLWQQGHLTSEIDKDLLIEYLAGDSGDICNTRKVFWGEYAQLVQRGMWDILLAQTQGLVFNALCMSNGMYIDREKAYENKAKLDKAIADTEAEVYTLLSNQGICIEAVNQFKLTSDYHISAWLYGGVIKYESREVAVQADGSIRFVKANFVQRVDTKDFIQLPDDIDLEDLDSFLGLHYSGVEFTKFKAGKNKGKVKPFRLDTEEQATRKCDALEVTKGVVDWSVYPDEFVKNFRKEYSGKRELADGSPVLSSSEEALNEIKYHTATPKYVVEVIDMLLDWTGKNKILGTYFLKENIRADGTVGRVSGMLQHLTPDNIHHHRLNVTATTTGRLSGNAQQFPRDSSAGVKEMYVSRYGDDGCVSEIDYTALEVVVQACFSRDEALIKTIQEGTDMHSLRASAFHGWTYDEFREAYLAPDHPKHKWADAARQDIKAPSFAFQYGATPAGIAYATGWSVADAEKFVETERALFPQVEAYFESVANEIMRDPKVEREMTDDGKYRVYQTGTYTTPSGITYSYRTYPKTYYDKGKPYEVMEFKPTQMRNYVIQGESSLFVQVATGWVVTYLAKNNFFDGKVTLVNTVHDAIILDLHKDVAHEVILQVKKILEWIPNGMRQYGYDLILPFPVVPEVGDNLQNQVTLDEYFGVK